MPFNPQTRTGTNGNTPYTSPYAGQAIDPTQNPIMPGFNDVYNPNTMSQLPQLQSMLGSNTYNEKPLQDLETNANSTSPSAWAQLAQTQNQNQRGSALNDSAQAGAAQTAQAEGNLALTGGLSSGARERVAESGVQGGIAANQGIESAAGSNSLNIGMQDANQKQQEQMALPGMENSAYAAKMMPLQMEQQALSQDTNNEMAQNQALNAFNMGAFQTQGQMYGANQTANAQLEAAGKTPPPNPDGTPTWDPDGSGSWNMGGGTTVASGPGTQTAQQAQQYMQGINNFWKGIPKS